MSNLPRCSLAHVKEDDMARLLVSDELWTKVEPLLPPVREAGTRGHPPVPNRAALTGILFVLKTGIAWEDLPVEMNCGCGMTCWRRLRDWNAAGVWQKLHETLLAEMRASGQLELAAMVADASYVRAFLGAPTPAPALSIAVKQALNTMC
jgi:transposase